MIKVAKRVAAEVLINSLTGGLIKLLNGKHIIFDGLKISVNSKEVSKKILAALFFKGYESSEKRFIEKYLRTDLPVVELGGSLGVISCVIGRKIEKQLIVVEANPNLTPLIEENLLNNQVQDFVIINGVVSAKDREHMYFLPGGTNLTGKIVDNHVKGAIKVASVNLSKIVKDYHLHQFNLVSDIEGAELFILLDDINGLAGCQQIIIETHNANANGIGYSYEDIREIIFRLGFTMLDSNGPNYVFERSVPCV